MNKKPSHNKGLHFHKLIHIAIEIASGKPTEDYETSSHEAKERQS